MIALAGWSLIGAALAAVAAVVLLSRITRTPHRVPPPVDATPEQRLALVEGYLVESERSWRSNTRRTSVLVGTLVALVILAVASTQDDRDHDREYVARFSYGSCLVTRENREAQRARDARAVAAAQAALNRHDAAVERSLAVEELPPELVPPDLLPLLEFLAVDAADRRAAIRQELVRDLTEARRDADEYVATFPVPECDPDVVDYVPSVNTPRETDD